jgi:hypothetical protein
MLSMGALSFAAPWLLVALAGLPILWWLLRVTPPAPRLLRFPAILLLFGLNQDEQTPSRTPWWLILLRMIVATLVILGLAHPLWNAGDRFAVSGPLVLVVDDGFAAARGWTDRQKAIDNLIARAERTGRPVMLLGTAPPADGAPIRASNLLTPAAARSAAEVLQPKPWPTARGRALEAFRAARFNDPANIVWLSDGVDDGRAQDFVRALQQRGTVTVMNDPRDAGTVALVPPPAGEPRLILKLLRAEAGRPAAHWVRGLDERGRIVLRERVGFANGAKTAEAAVNLPTELRNRLARLELEDVRSAAAVALVDERYRRRPVGIVTNRASRSEAQPLLSELFYLERALTPYAEVRRGTAQELLARPLAVLIVPDAAGLGESALGAIKSWMEQGGTLLRFAGPRVAQNADDLLPVMLRRGDRTLGGAMSWSQPAKLAPFDDTSPFAGLQVPAEILINRQVLAQPALDLPNHTWARLADGTPLVTAADRGRGRTILIHTTANTDWSNLALSGLFVEMLRRVVAVSQGVSGARAQALPPVSTLDGFGRMGDPPPSAQPLSETADRAAAGATAPEPKAAGAATTVNTTPAVNAQNPPGLYGNESARVALNLAGGLTGLAAIGPLPASVAELSLAAPSEFDVKPWLLFAALALLLIDMWIGLVLRGLAPSHWPFSAQTGESRSVRAARTSAAVVVLLLILSGTAYAQEGTAAFDPQRAAEATFETRLAYVLTGDSRIDQVSRAGLEGLSLMLRTRTSVEPKEPLSVDIERDEIAVFPFLYWPISPTQPSPSAAARERIARYLASGGMILFDTRDQAPTTLTEPGGEGTTGPGAGKLRDILRGLAIPALMPVSKGHILTKAFYLLSEFPGRWTGGAVWVERLSGHANDGVSSVIIGANDFAAAWAVDSAGQPSFPVVPGGARQREMAYRFGINVIMYALTGNYKADQVHVPAILERLGQ